MAILVVKHGKVEHQAAFVTGWCKAGDCGVDSKLVYGVVKL